MEIHLVGKQNFLFNLKSELAPKHSQRVGNNVVQWFEISNSYVVTTHFIHSILKEYLEAKNKTAFVENLQKNYNVSQLEATDYYIELSGFLKDMNSTPSTDDINTASDIVIPDAVLSKHYAFGSLNFTINYSSEKISNLIDPQLKHGEVEKSSNNNTIFDIFLKDDLLYLYKNQTPIGSYLTKHFHLLQGKFSMELAASLYDNQESDWLATFHASAICNDREAIMIIGNSGNGKSTLSAVLMAHGYDLLTDDFTPMLADNQHLYRFPGAISIKKGAFATIETLFEDFSTLESKLSNSKPVVVKFLPPSKPFNTSQKHFECRKIVRVHYSENSSSELRESSPETILQTFIPDSWISPNAEHSKQFLNWLKDLKFYELIYSDNDFAVAKFKELFEQ